MVYKCIEYIQYSLWPSQCVLCGSTGISADISNGDRQLDLCQGCYQALPINFPACHRCGQPLPALSANIETTIETTAGRLCGQCMIEPPAYQQCFALLRYRPPIPRLMMDLKFHDGLHLIRVFGELMTEKLAPRACLPQLLLPVPLHPARLRQRGYNQAVELAQVIGRRLGIRVDLHQCRRIRHTEVQSTLPACARRGNVRGAFALQHKLDAKHVAIVDDVMTTGSTLAAIASLLQRHGVQNIEVWVIARAGKS
ncbi:MAG: ComF family protein [Gammaproteobacteria bacterium]|nr:MAG: ComF family protein [Gammaproteobacteria bacterium]